ncbi:putative lipid II flippase FtsW [Phytoactinopolyspora halotolerans]|uniref:Probable peptidoglycan glycosyltransferase FtsW n=1 Tax=Phytoactinopolyspora halotolerans TaxID=1981512 RepID=A0A6L9SF51_9ACTN|nr:putative lipid II flippase FtsW [Phytoactinopolyspora halotolerans]NEE03092.1 putative lipid II flippase FtsW [Phytoactinopolyspora halotolerans]
MTAVDASSVGRRGPGGARDALARFLRRPLASYYLVLGAAGLLLLLGLVMVFSSTTYMSTQQFGHPAHYFLRQLLWVTVALPIAWVISRMPLRVLRALSLLMVIGATGLLALTFVPGFGVVRGGSRNWLDFGGPFLLQPSEAAKLALIIWVAHVFANKGKLIRHWKQLLIPVAPVAGFVIALTLGQNDMGTAAIMVLILLTMLWVIGVPTWLFGLMMGVVGVVGVYFIFTAPHRIERMGNFLDPFADYTNTGYQAANSIFAFANGGWWGTGLGASTQKWGTLPEQHTDFIFAILGEELGLPGTLMVIVLFLALGYAGLRIAMRTTDTFVRLAAAGITGWFMVQTVVNLGMVLAVFPVVGVPLPLVSYGGASIVVTVAAVGVLLSLAKHEPGAKEALAARREQRLERREGRTT